MVRMKWPKTRCFLFFIFLRFSPIVLFQLEKTSYVYSIGHPKAEIALFSWLLYWSKVFFFSSGIAISSYLIIVSVGIFGKKTNKQR